MENMMLINKDGKKDDIKQENYNVQKVNWEYLGAMDRRGKDDLDL